MIDDDKKIFVKSSLQKEMTQLYFLIFFIFPACKKGIVIEGNI